MSDAGALRTLRTGALVVACACACAIGGALAPSRAEAQSQPQLAGSLGAHLAIADGDIGGAILLDVWAAIDWLRIGGFVGAGAIPSDRDAYNRVFMPLGISAAAQIATTDQLALSVSLRAGLWGGATQAEKLTLGAFVGGGAYLGFVLGGGAILNVGADVWGIISSDAWHTPSDPDDRVSASTWAIAPGVGLSWTPEIEPEPAPLEESE
ncbi:MAG: hypothetical protein M3Y87_02945 [Myxococcota bacterium]|nr:hypothetical protein [Myxococcota bacterium]